MSKSVPLILLSSVLLIFAYPPFGCWPLAWLALVPLLASLEGRSPRKAFVLGYSAGVLFFAGTLNWLVNMAFSAGIPLFLSWLAFILLSMYLAVYFGLFGLGTAALAGKRPLWRLFLLPALWTGLECFRDRFLGGFGWLTLGSSQSSFLPIIQIADMTGVFGVSFLVVLGNLVLRELAVRIRRKSSGPTGPLVSLTAVLLFVAALTYGFIRLHQFDAGRRSSITAAVVQPNIPQQRKWVASEGPAILEEIFALSREAVKSHPDLIIWPETSFPGYLWEDPEAYVRIKEFVRGIGTPLLFGAVTREEGNYYNTAVLLSAQGREIERYNKRHLVIFGEYLPLRRFFPWLASLIPIEDFTPGNGVTLFPFGQGGEGTFAVVICFEDTIARVVRPFVRDGARFLVNLTNDAWFMDSQEPFLHLQAAVFRAVENRRSLVRAANTGVSCVIDPSGRVTGQIRAPSGKMTLIAGAHTVTVPLRRDRTLYTRFGDIFALGCILFVLTGIFVVKNSS